MINLTNIHQNLHTVSTSNYHPHHKPTTTKTTLQPQARLTPAMVAAVKAQFDGPHTPPAYIHGHPGRGAPPRSAPPTFPGPSSSTASAPLVSPPPISQPHPHYSTLQALPTPALLDAAFRTYADRCATELAHLRTLCARALLTERHARDTWRAHCVAFRRERDVARDRVRVLIGERESLLVRPAQTGTDEDKVEGGKEDKVKEEEGEGEGGTKPASESSRSAPSRDSTPSATAVASDPEDDLSAYLLPYPFPSPTTPITPIHAATMSASVSLPSPTYPANVDLPTRTQGHKRSLSADDALPSPSFPASPSSSSPPAPLAASTSILKPTRAKRDYTVFDITVTENPHGGRLIPTERVLKKRRQSEDLSAPGGEYNIGLRLGGGTPPPPRHGIELSHVDLMYVPQEGRLLCRVCLLAANKRSTSSPGLPPLPVVEFPTDASWDALRDHCVGSHPEECSDVARLHPAEVYELRRRLAGR